MYGAKDVDDRLQISSTRLAWLYPSFLQDSLAALWNGIYYAVLVYDVSSADSFESCKMWLEELKKAR
jgi:hypothetical protein